jgi:hypothetical protein
VDIVEALGVIASLITIALFVWGGWKWWTHRSQGEMRPSANRKEALAEDVADELEILKRLVDTGWLGLIQHGEAWGDKRDLIENYDALQVTGVKLLGRARRVEIAFGKDSRAAGAVREAAQAGEDAYYALQNIRRERADGALEGHAREQMRRYREEDTDKLRAARDRMAAAQDEFAAAVNAAA